MPEVLANVAVLAGIIGVEARASVNLATRIGWRFSAVNPMMVFRTLIAAPSPFKDSHSLRDSLGATVLRR
jgi:hypothetical protein